MRTLMLIPVITLFVVTGCASKDHKDAANGGTDSSVKVIHMPNSNRIRIDCSSEKDTMQSCIDAANQTCPEGWIVYTYRNDDTGTLKVIRKSQKETKDTGFMIGGGRTDARSMTVVCR